MYQSCNPGNHPSLGATKNSAKYMPSANSEPCARLICSITPTISMKPSAISANSRPSVRPLMRWGRRSNTLGLQPSSRTPQRGDPVPYGSEVPVRDDALGIHRRHLLVGHELALCGRRRVERLLGRRPGEDLVVIGLVRRLRVALGEIDRLLHLV